MSDSSHTSRRRLPGPLVVATIFVATALGGCREPGRADLGVVATVDGLPVTAEDLREQLARDRRFPGPGGRLPSDRRRLLDRTIDDLLLLREARRRGIRVTYGDLEPVRRRLAKRLLDAELVGAPVRPEELPEEEVRAEFERSRGEMGHPEMRRVEIARTTSRRRAEALLRRAIDVGGDADRLRQVIRRGSEAPRLAEAVEYGGFFPREEATRYLGEELARDAFELPEGELVCPEPRPFHGGWAVVAVTERVAPREVSYEEAAPQIRERLLGRRREEALDRFVDGFRGDYDIVVSEEHIALVDWRGEETGSGAPTDAPAPRDAR